MSQPRVVVAFCTYNRAERLPGLVAALRTQRCDEPFEILAVDNNSADGTQQVLRQLAMLEGLRLRFVKETTQGIVPARNRVLTEASSAEYLLMLDDDEIPAPGWVQAGISALRDEGLECAGGRVRVRFEPGDRPRWLGDELLGFLAEVDHGDQPFRIVDVSTPVWTANVAYQTSLFADGLKFDPRYSRVGKGVGGGEDVVMFETLVRKGRRMGYRPDMVVEHCVEAWRLRRRYFLRLHYTSGLRAGMYSTQVSGRTFLGVPLYLYRQAANQGFRVVQHAGLNGGRWLRQAMTFAHTCGRIVGVRRRTRAAS